MSAEVLGSQRIPDIHRTGAKETCFWIGYKFKSQRWLYCVLLLSVVVVLLPPALRRMESHSLFTQRGRTKRGTVGWRNQEVSVPHDKIGILLGIQVETWNRLLSP